MPECYGFEHFVVAIYTKRYLRRHRRLLRFRETVCVAGPFRSIRGARSIARKTRQCKDIRTHRWSKKDLGPIFRNVATVTTIGRPKGCSRREWVLQWLDQGWVVDP